MLLKLKNRKAFTLTEMIVVIAIIGILAGVLIPTVVGYIRRAQKSSDQQTVDGILDRYDEYIEAMNTNTLSPANQSFSAYYLEIATKELPSCYLELTNEATSDDNIWELGKNFIYMGKYYAVVVNMEDRSNVEYEDLEDYTEIVGDERMYKNLQTLGN